MIAEAKKFARLTAQKRSMTTELGKINKRLEELGAIIIDKMVLDGVDSLTVDGFNLFPRTTTWARPTVSAADAVKVLLAYGMNDYIVLGSQKTSTLFREDGGEGLPPEVQAAFETYERVSLSARKSD